MHFPLFKTALGAIHILFSYIVPKNFLFFHMKMSLMILIIMFQDFIGLE